MKTFLTILLTLALISTVSCSKKKSSSANQEAFTEADSDAIYMAIVDNNVAKVDDMLKANPKLVDAMFLRGGPHGGWPLIVIASSNGNKPIAEMLISYGANINAKNYSSETALLYAAAKGHKEIVEILLAHGADPNVKNDADATALSIATSQGNTEIANLLRQHGAKE
jgi:ankyrin repeat protein